MNNRIPISRNHHRPSSHRDNRRPDEDMSGLSMFYHDLQDYIEPNGDPIDLQSLQPTEYCDLAARFIHKRAIRLAEHHTDALLTVFHDYNEDTDL
jgi:hypothetical protein